MRRKTHFCGGECELWYMISVYKAHTRVSWPTRIIHQHIHTMRVWCIRENKSDRNLIDQISGKVLMTMSNNLIHTSIPPPFAHAISLSVVCAFLDFPLPSAVLQSNLWSQLLTVAIALYTPTLVYEQGAKSPT